MIREGRIALLRFPQTDQGASKLRPVLVLRRAPGPYDDWLVCMISSQLHHEVPGMDIVIPESEPHFPDTGLKMTSLIRITRLAVVASQSLRGSVGHLPDEHVGVLRKRLSEWLSDTRGAGAAK